MNSLILSLFLVFSANAEIVEKTVAIVNTELVLESDFVELQKRIGKEGLIDESLLDGKSAQILKNNRSAQLNYLINEKIIESEIRKQNLAVTNDRVDSEIKSMARRNQVSEAELKKLITQQGVDFEEYKKILKMNLEKRALMDAEIFSKLRISDEDALNEYLKQNPKSKPSIDEFSVSHIFFNPQKGGAREALTRAENVLSKLRSGENFEKLAQNYSEDPNFSSGGALGSFKSGDFLSEIEAAISSLSVNETTGIVKSRMGYHIVKLTGKKLTVDPKFEAVKEKIKSSLLEKSFNRQIKNWIQNKRDESFIRINE